jgi:ABC-type Fe3+-hydroxamate transport system substrate-binding protein
MSPAPAKAATTPVTTASTLTDDLGRTFDFGETGPARVVSLVPSLTETLFALGCERRLVGVTQFCVHPPQAQQLPRVGGTKTASAQAVLSLQPDLVLASADENKRELADACEAAGVPVFATHPRSLPDIESMIRRLGQLFGASKRGAAIAADMERRRLAIEAEVAEESIAVPVVSLIWKGPWMTTGPTTFMTDLLQRAGGVVVQPEGDDRDWPELSDADLDAAADAFMLLHNEPYHFKEADAEEWHAKGRRAAVCDGQLTTWAGPRIIDGLEMVSTLLSGPYFAGGPR